MERLGHCALSERPVFKTPVTENDLPPSLARRDLKSPANQICKLRRSIKAAQGQCGYTREI